MRDSLDGAERILVDPQGLSQSTGIPHAINHYSPSWDGRTLAYGVSSGGSEMASLHLMDIASGRVLREPIPRVVAGANWAPDSRHLAFNQLRALAYEAPDTETYLDTTVYLLDCEHPGDPARPLFGPLVNKALKLDRLDVASAEFSPESSWMLARHDRQDCRRRQALRRATLETQTCRDRLGADFHRGGQDHGCPAGRRHAVPQKPRRRAAQSRTGLVTQNTGAGQGKGGGARAARRRARRFRPRSGRADLYRSARRVQYTRTPARTRQGWPRRGYRAKGARLDAPDRRSRPRLPRRLLSTSTWTAPPRVIKVKPDGAVQVTNLRNNKRPPGAPDVEVREVEVVSHDGVKVPLAILYRKGTPA